MQSMLHAAEKIKMDIQSHLAASASCTIQIGVLLAQSQQAHITSLQHHAGADSISSFLTKGVLATGASYIYQGKIKIDEHAVLSHAELDHRALLLDDGVFSQSMPELEVKTDAVVCRHASAVSSYDEEMLWYLSSRGMAYVQARKCLMDSFFSFDVKNGHEVAFWHQKKERVQKFF
ncbi:MAG TPA: SufD family Fe-S cluster assembly protein, partial [Candidatus Bathyarchaeia archaeon]|nr:SufD family Fe-S cluster assembly protein [Candidatus Bathyarchaeia archaeon]